MKRILAISAIILGLGASLSAQEHGRSPAPRRTPSTTAPSTNTPATPDGWVRFTSEPGRFSVLMPEIPEDKVQTVPSEHGPYTTHLFIVHDDRNVYLIGWVDYDPAFNFNRQSEMEANRDNFVKGVNATLTSTRSFTIDSYPVIEFAAETADRVFKSRVYMVGRRPYQIVIGYPKGDDEIAPTSQFLNSFKISR